MIKQKQINSVKENSVQMQLQQQQLYLILIFCAIIGYQGVSQMELIVMIQRLLAYKQHLKSVQHLQLV